MKKFKKMVRWMYGVLDGQKAKEGFVQPSGYSEDEVRRDKLRWFGHLECKCED